jgi:hypothetical protein
VSLGIRVLAQGKNSEKESKYYSHCGVCEWQDQSSSRWLGLNRRLLIKRLKTADKALETAEKKKRRETGKHLISICLYVRRKRRRMRRRKVESEEEEEVDSDSASKSPLLLKLQWQW